MTENGKVPFQICNLGLAIAHLKQVYGNDPVGGLKEYISNAIDAYGGRRGKDVTIEVTVDRAKGMLTVQDYGCGMTKEKLSKLPQELAKGEKKSDPLKNIGEKSIALLAFCGIGERCDIYSRTEDNKGVYNFLSMERDLNDATPGRLEERLAEKGMEHKFAHGTRVVISNVSPGTIDGYFNVSKLKYSLGSFFDPLLRDKGINIEIGWYGKTERLEEVEPLMREGKQVVHDLQETKKEIIELNGKKIKGEAEIRLWANPDGVNEKISIYNKGVKILDSVTHFKEFDKYPWNSGKISGYINANFLDLIPSRDGIVRDKDRFPELCNILAEHESAIALQARLAEEEGSKKRVSDLLSDMTKKIAMVYFRKPNTFKVGTGTPRDPTDASPSLNNSGKTKREPNCPFNVQTKSFGAHERGLTAKLDGDTVLVNEDHQSFKHYADKRKASDAEVIEYYAGVLCKEFAWGDYVEGRKAQTKSENPSLTMNEESMRAIQERAAEIRLALLEEYGILKRKKPGKKSARARALEEQQGLKKLGA